MADNFPQWEEAHYNELNKPTTDLERYFRDRDTPAPYVAPPHVESEVQTVVTLEMKRYFAAGGFTTFCVVVIAAAEQGAFAAAATAGGYIAFVGGGIGVAWVVLRSCFTWTPSGEDAKHGANQPPPNDGGKYEWYQEQRQGWRKM